METTALIVSKIQEALPDLILKRAEPMKNHTSFKIGGEVNAMFFPKNAEQFRTLRVILKDYDIKPLIIGNGTNLLVEDKPLDIYVIKMTGISELRLHDGNSITAGCGVSLSRLSMFACEHGLSGLEFAHGIPGTLGGAVSMNAGAYGSEMKDIVTASSIANIDFESATIIDHEFGYRTSRFSVSDEIIMSSTLTLTACNKDTIKTNIEELTKRRRESQPLNQASAGSTFKRPKAGYAAALIEEAGLKGYSRGGAQVSDKHAGFVINKSNASFNDVITVISHVKSEIARKFGTDLELEIKIIHSPKGG